ncbi:MAG: M4 family metallopeptidase [Legionella sp.]
MKYRRYCQSSIVSCLLIISTPPCSAAQVISLQNSSWEQLERNFSLHLPGVFTNTIMSGNRLKFEKSHRDSQQRYHIGLQQYYGDFPVFQGYAMVHSEDSPSLLLSSRLTKTMNGLVFIGLDTELGKPAANFVSNGSRALKEFSSQYSHANLSEETVTPMIYIDKFNRAFWAYQVSVFVQQDGQIPQRPTAIIDANTFNVFVKWNDVKLIRHAVKGQGFGGNIRTKKYHYGKDKPFLDILHDSDTGICRMENNQVKIVDMAGRFQHLNSVMRFNCTEDNEHSGRYWTGYQNDGYDPENGAYSPSNDALYAGYIITQMFNEWYGIPPLVAGNKPLQLIMRVHYGRSVENAFWDGKQMTFGDGASKMYPLVSLGVAAHEISHGFTQQHSNLIYFGQAGGMNESFSDMTAQAAEFFDQKNNTWSIGADIMKKTSGDHALRYMDKPSRDGRSLDYADQYKDGMDVHYSSGVYNRLFYLLATRKGWDTHRAFNVMVKANMDYWTPYATFVDGACGLLNATSDLGYNIDDLKQVLDDVAINHHACD